jgi:aminoglycoside/choline kinase family phosphotransferase
LRLPSRAVNSFVRVERILHKERTEVGVVSGQIPQLGLVVLSGLGMGFAA